MKGSQETVLPFPIPQLTAAGIYENLPCASNYTIHLILSVTWQHGTLMIAISVSSKVKPRLKQMQLRFDLKFFSLLNSNSADNPDLAEGCSCLV